MREGDSEGRKRMGVKGETERVRRRERVRESEGEREQVEGKKQRVRGGQNGGALLEGQKGSGRKRETE